MSRATDTTVGPPGAFRFGFAAVAAGGCEEKSGIAVSGVSLPKRQATTTSAVRMPIAASATSTTLDSTRGFLPTAEVELARSGVSSSPEM